MDIAASIMTANTALSFSLFIYLLYFLLSKQTKSAQENLRVICNLCLICGITGSLGLSIVKLTRQLLGTNTIIGIQFHLQQFFQCSVEFAYIPYCWARSKDIVRRQSPNLFKCLRVLVPVFLVLSYIPFITAIVFSNWKSAVAIGIDVYMISTGLVGLSMLVFDLILIKSFVQFQWSMGSDGQNKLVIISQHGLVATFLCILALGSFGATALLGIGTELSDISISTTYFLFTLVWGSLLLMKVRLHYAADESPADKLAQEIKMSEQRISEQDLSSKDSPVNKFGGESTANQKSPPVSLPRSPYRKQDAVF